MINHFIIKDRKKRHCSHYRMFPLKVVNNYLLSYTNKGSKYNPPVPEIIRKPPFTIRTSFEYSLLENCSFLCIPNTKDEIELRMSLISKINKMLNNEIRFLTFKKTNFWSCLANFNEKKLIPDIYLYKPQIFYSYEKKFVPLKLFIIN